jgi:hypothetical protein
MLLGLLQPAARDRRKLHIDVMCCHTMCCGRAFRMFDLTRCVLADGIHRLAILQWRASA